MGNLCHRPCMYGEYIWSSAYMYDVYMADRLRSILDPLGMSPMPNDHTGMMIS